jgi:hypothetical protein
LDVHAFGRDRRGQRTLFAAGNESLVLVLVAIALLGFAVGGVFAVMPKLVLVGVPQGETASAFSINQIARSIGMSIGSALAGFLLAATTLNGAMNAPRPERLHHHGTMGATPTRRQRTHHRHKQISASTGSSVDNVLTRNT